MNTSIDFQRIIDDIRGLDLNNVGAWPRWVYIVSVLLLAATLIFAGHHYFIKPQQAELLVLEEQEQQLRREFERKQRKVANLDAYREQLKEMERRFGKMLRQLPGKAEIANLLTDISQTRAAAGLEEELFQPLGEIRRDFYAEVPNQLTVVGNYHQLATFVSGISAMPRIVTVHNIRITPVNQAAEQLRMSLVAKTYRYLEDEEFEGEAVQ